MCSDPDSLAMLCRSRSTHWKQTVVYLKETITICQGEVITGQFHSHAQGPCECARSEGHMRTASPEACNLHLHTSLVDKRLLRAARNGIGGNSL